MKTSILLRNVLILSTILLVLHLLASEYAWYWHYWWFDIVMHFLGGFVLGLFGMWFVLRLNMEIRTRAVFYTIVAGTMVIAVGWEVFEYIHDIAGRGHYIVDTTTDLMLGAFGAAYAYITVRQKDNKYE